MQTLKIESENIRIPFEVVNKFKGREIQFVSFEDGFIMKPVGKALYKTKEFSKLSKLRHRKLIIGDADELLNIKADEWHEPDNL